MASKGLRQPAQRKMRRKPREVGERMPIIARLVANNGGTPERCVAICRPSKGALTTRAFYPSATGGVVVAMRPVAESSVASVSLTGERRGAAFGSPRGTEESGAGRSKYGLSATRGGACSLAARYWMQLNTRPGSCRSSAA